MADPNQHPFQAEAQGECDVCHGFDVPVAQDDSEPGNFDLCRKCWTKHLRRAQTKRERDAHHGSEIPRIVR